MAILRGPAAGLGGPAQAAEGFVDRIDLQLLHPGLEAAHQPLAHVGVEGVVGAAHHHAVLFQLAAHLEIGGAHGEAQGPGLGAAGDDAAVVVGEHHQGPAPQGGIEGRLAGGIEVVAIDQHDRHPGGRPGSGIGRLLRGPWIGAAPRGCGGGEGRKGHGCLGWRG